MKKGGLLFIALLISTFASAQFYVSASAGYALPGTSSVLGTETTTSETKNVYGSYGAGFIPQFRAGYMLSEKFGLEAGFAYLHGKEYTIASTPAEATVSQNITSAARAYGLSISAVYNITDNFYGRFGFLTKVGGKTTANAKVSVAEFPVIGPAGTLIGAAPLEVEVERTFRGQFPMGYIGSLGYKTEVSENLYIFGEIEYSGISVKRKESTLESYKATLAGQELPQAQLAAGLAAVGQTSLYELVAEKITYEDSLPLDNTDANKRLTEKAPYSSFGVNVGITYIFN